MFDKLKNFIYNTKAFEYECNLYGGVAQLVRAAGSYPAGRWFESDRRYQSSTVSLIIWPLGQAVKTSPFHGGNTSSNLVGVTKQSKDEPVSFRRRVRLCF